MDCVAAWQLLKEGVPKIKPVDLLLSFLSKADFYEKKCVGGKGALLNKRRGKCIVGQKSVSKSVVRPKAI